MILDDPADIEECYDPLYRCRGVNEDPVDRTVPEDCLPELVPLLTLKNGPSNPNARSFRTSSVHEAGVSLCCPDTGFHPGQFLDSTIINGGNGKAAAQPDDNPAINDFHEVAATFFKGLSRCPDTGQFRNFAIVWLLVIDDIISCMSESRFNVLNYHGILRAGPDIFPVLIRYMTAFK